MRKVFDQDALASVLPVAGARDSCGELQTPSEMVLASFASTMLAFVNGFAVSAPACCCLPVFRSASAAPPVSPGRNRSSSLRCAHRLALGTWEHTRNPMEAAISPDGKTVAWSFRSAERIRAPSQPDCEFRPAKSTVIKPAGWSFEPAAAMLRSGRRTARRSRIPRPARARAKQPGHRSISWSKKTGRVATADPCDRNDRRHCVVARWQVDRLSVCREATRSAGALAAMKPWAGVIGEDGVEVQRVAASKSRAATLRRSPGEAACLRVQLVARLKQLAYVAAPPPGENNWWVAQLYTKRPSRWRNRDGHPSRKRSMPPILWTRRRSPAPFTGCRSLFRAGLLTASRSLLSAA